VERLLGQFAQTGGLACHPRHQTTHALMDPGIQTPGSWAKEECTRFEKEKKQTWKLVTEGCSAAAGRKAEAAQWHLPLRSS
jgi:hypothetical protein